MIGYGITLKVSKSKYKIRYYLMGSILIFPFLYINVLKYHNFQTKSIEDHRTQHQEQDQERAVPD